MKRYFLILISLATQIIYAQSGNDLFMDNAKYLYGKTAAGTNTRIIGINSSDNLYLGSVDAAINNLLINLNGQNRVYIDGASGNMGVGTSPTARLDVRGTLKASHNNGHFFTFFSSGDGNSYINFSGGSSSSRIGFQIDNSSKMSIMNNGRVGIGTAVPQHQLDVRGAIASTHNNGHKITAFTSGDGNSYLNFSGGSSSSRIGFQIDSGSKMSIMNNGSVGIGTTQTGTYKLAVEGSIRAREVKVDAAAWPDYVFKEDYDLPTLDEVEKHIQEKGHLINIPSAQEMEKNGIQLGEMNMKLLEKIEELTLYILEQERKLEKMDYLENEIKEMKKLIKQSANMKI